MQTLTRDAIVRILGPVDNAFSADLLATGANEQDLRQAYAWFTNDEALINEGRPLPDGRVSEVIEVLRLHLGAIDDEP